MAAAMPLRADDTRHRHRKHERGRRREHPVVHGQPSAVSLLLSTASRVLARDRVLIDTLWLRPQRRGREVGANELTIPPPTSLPVLVPRREPVSVIHCADVARRTIRKRI